MTSLDLALVSCSDSLDGRRTDGRFVATWRMRTRKPRTDNAASVSTEYGQFVPGAHPEPPLAADSDLVLGNDGMRRVTWPNDNGDIAIRQLGFKGSLLLREALRRQPVSVEDQKRVECGRTTLRRDAERHMPRGAEH